MTPRVYVFHLLVILTLSALVGVMGGMHNSLAATYFSISVIGAGLLFYILNRPPSGGWYAVHTATFTITGMALGLHAYKGNVFWLVLLAFFTGLLAWSGYTTDHFISRPAKS